MVISFYERKENNPSKDKAKTHPIWMIKMVFLLTDLPPSSQVVPPTASTIAKTGCKGKGDRSGFFR
jgi:hypothetical protein